MARRLRIWVKKQGSRTTGAQRLGEWGETAFFAVLFLLGSASLIYLGVAQWWLPDAQRWQLGQGLWLVVLVLASFVVLGGRGLALSLLKLRTSAERRAAFMRDAGRLRMLSEAGDASDRFPSVPRGVNVANSPGVRQPYRLPVSYTPAWKMLVAAAFCLVWNGLTLFLIRQVWYGYRAGEPDRLATVALLPFLAIGGWAVTFLARQVLQQVRVGPTLVEISQHPVAPGTPFRCYVAQSGRVRLRELAVHLICSEETTCRQGTDIRIDRQVVYNDLVQRQEDVEIGSGTPVELELDCVIPDGLMHSFQSQHNAVVWQFVVRGVPERGEAFESPFPLIVVPASLPSETHGSAH